jgi:hypothetical protein
MGTQPAAATPGVSSAANAYQTAFNTAYYLSKPPAFQPLYNGRPGAPNAALAPLTITQVWALVGTLIAGGWPVDEEIDAEGMDPLTTMFMRELYGNTWEPSGLGASTVSSVDQPGAVVSQGQYSGPVPAGQIKVSTLIEDYPPFPAPANNAPVAPPTPLAASPVGIRIIPMVPSAPNYVGDVFRCAVANDGYGIGAPWTGTSGSFEGTWTKQALEMGVMIVWTKTA